jgi:TfoX/Sxy family transcriptional regulator of competence genes
MGYDKQAVEHVRRILAGRQDVVEKRMIGGLSFLINGAMCCGVTGADLMVRVGPDAVASALAQPHVRPMEFAGRRLAAFVRIEPEGYQTDEALAQWIQRGLDFVATLPAR